VTTGKLSEDLKREMAADSTRPIALIDGELLVRLCIEYDLGFAARPTFLPDLLREELRDQSALPPKGTEEPPAGTGKPDELVVRSAVSENDVRRGILRLPALIREALGGAEEITVQVGADPAPRSRKLSVDRRWVSAGLGGADGAYRREGLLTEAGTAVPMAAEWRYSPSTQIAYVRFLHPATPAV